MDTMNFLLLFGLANAPETFMCFINGVFKPFLDSFFIVFIDKILMYSKSEEEYVAILRLFWVSLESKNYTQNFPSVNFVEVG